MKMALSLHLAILFFLPTQLNAQTDTTLNRKLKECNNPVASQYLFGSGAIPMKKGEGYYQNLLLFIHMVEFAITDHISVKAGTELLSTTFDGDMPVSYNLAPRIGYKVRPLMYIGGGALYSLLPSYFNTPNEHRLMPLVMTTLGNNNDNVTVSLGWMFRKGYYYDNLEVAQMPTVGISGMKRLGKWIGLVTENWIYQEPYGWTTPDLIGNAELYYSVGLRAIGKNVTCDAGIMGSTDWWSLLRSGIPYVTVTIHFPWKRSSSNPDMS